ncbi:gas vesicle protein [Streptomyces sp. MBT27]|uniref:gas vesicle protein GvpO n=1 Tax=Streptomyces sp. MBT27 TaxID=1488356 RepID=UPI00142145A0|nr:gas vesicle protein [Streptomyces sp. MBT27]
MASETASNTTAKRASGRSGESSTATDEKSEPRASERARPRAKRPPSKPSMRVVMGNAVEELCDLLRCPSGSVSAIKPSDSGWTADIEVLELERIPDTSSVMASYRVQLDERGELTGYERTRRYQRGAVDR